MFTPAELMMAGFETLVPVPRGQKSPPPAGTTGKTGCDLDEEEFFELYEEGDNFAWRLPRDIIGLDFDLYKNPAALQTLEKRLGTLPHTLSVSSGSGGFTSFFRLPSEDLTLEQGLGEAVDIIQWGHRYAMFPPSLHSSGKTYHFLLGGRKVDGFLPEFSELALLPSSWLEAVQSKKVSVTPEIVGMTQIEYQNIPVFPLPMCSVCRTALSKAKERLSKGEQGRHDAMVSSAYAFSMLAQKGHSLGDILEQYFSVWKGQFTPEEAQHRPLLAEFTRAIGFLPEKTGSDPCRRQEGGRRRNVMF